MQLQDNLVFELVGESPAPWFFQINREDGDISVNKSIRYDRLMQYRVSVLFNSVPYHIYSLCFGHIFWDLLCSFIFFWIFYILGLFIESSYCILQMVQELIWCRKKSNYVWTQSVPECLELSQYIWLLVSQIFMTETMCLIQTKFRKVFV